MINKLTRQRWLIDFFFVIDTDTLWVRKHPCVFYALCVILLPFCSILIGFHPVAVLAEVLAVVSC